MTRNKTQSNISSKKYYDANREKIIARAKVRSRTYRLEVEYGITAETYETMLKDQDGHCAICNTEEPGKPRTRFCIDHDHATGKVRGLLCFDCNVSLGKFRDSVDLLEKAIKYLKRSTCHDNDCLQ